MFIPFCPFEDRGYVERILVSDTIGDLIEHITVGIFIHAWCL